jgi:hypothetical protein
VSSKVESLAKNKMSYINFGLVFDIVYLITAFDSFDKKNQNAGVLFID